MGYLLTVILTRIYSLEFCYFHERCNSIWGTTDAAILSRRRETLLAPPGSRGIWVASVAGNRTSAMKHFPNSIKVSHTYLGNSYRHKFSNITDNKCFQRKLSLTSYLPYTFARHYMEYSCRMNAVATISGFARSHARRSRVQLTRAHIVLLTNTS